MVMLAVAFSLRLTNGRVLSDASPPSYVNIVHLFTSRAPFNLRTLSPHPYTPHHDTCTLNLTPRPILTYTLTSHPYNILSSHLYTCHNTCTPKPRRYTNYLTCYTHTSPLHFSYLTSTLAKTPVQPHLTCTLIISHVLSNLTPLPYAYLTSTLLTLPLHSS